MQPLISLLSTALHGVGTVEDAIGSGDAVFIALPVLQVAVRMFSNYYAPVYSYLRVPVLNTDRIACHSTSVGPFESHK